MTAAKESRYLDLVRQRQNCDFEQMGLLNPSRIMEGAYDTGHLGPWSAWQHNLEASLLVIGQDWGNERYFLEDHRYGHPKCKGPGHACRKRPGSDCEFETTSSRLSLWMKRLGHDLGSPHDEVRGQQVFMTNLVLGIKPTGKSASIRTDWKSHGLHSFLLPLIDIVQPKAVLVLGAQVWSTLNAHYKWGRPKLSSAVHELACTVPHGGRAFPLFHPAARAKNHTQEQQAEDWGHVAEQLFQTRELA